MSTGRKEAIKYRQMLYGRMLIDDRDTMHRIQVAAANLSKHQASRREKLTFKKIIK